MNTTTSSAPINEMDERQMSLTAVKAAEDKLQQLCASHAATFVAVEHRGAALTSSLETLLQTIDKALPNVRESQGRLQQNEGSDEKDKECQGDSSSSTGTVSAAPTASATLTSLAEKHRLRRRTLLQHSSLLELLELPNLMDACVRGHLYEEALSIASFANTLERFHLEESSTSKKSSHSNLNAEEKQEDSSMISSVASTYGNPVVWNVVTEVRKRESDLHRHLLHRLRTEVSMPICLEVVTALRRLNGVELDRISRATSNVPSNKSIANHSGMMKNPPSSSSSINAPTLDLEQVHNAMEFKLQVLFLENRDVWLDGTTAAMMKRTKGLTTAAASGAGLNGVSDGPSSSTSETLLDSIDSYRTRCFEITTQFLAIFRASSSANKSINSAAQQDNSSLQLLSMWTSRRIQLFLQTHLSPSLLSTYITDTSILRDVYEATVFFATSMGRIGADFSPLLPSIFEPRCVQIVTGHWKEGVHKLGNMLRICREAGVASPLYSTTHSGTIEDGATNAATASTNDLEDSTLESKALAPPRQLLSYPPLARLVNAFLVGLNELRRCLYPNIFPNLRTIFQSDVVDKVKGILSSHQRSVLTPGFLSKGDDAEKLRTLAGEYMDEFEACMEPYMRNALELAFGSYENIVIKTETHADEEEDEEIKEDQQEEQENEMIEENIEEDQEDQVEEKDQLEQKDEQEKMLAEEPIEAMP